MSTQPNAKKKVNKARSTNSRRKARVNLPGAIHLFKAIADTGHGPSLIESLHGKDQVLTMSMATMRAIKAYVDAKPELKHHEAISSHWDCDPPIC